MDMILWATVLSVLVQGSLCSTGETNRGCLKWSRDETNDKNVCCDICQPGNYLVKDCGPTPQDLCAPCKPKTYTVEPKKRRCEQCTQCVGAQVLVKECTATRDTQCGCKKELTCGNAQCSFCVKECGKGEEPTQNRSCRKCPNGTFNDQIHQRCKPWSSTCPSPHEMIVAGGNEFHDIMCVAIHTVKSSTEKPESNPIEKEWMMVLSILPCFALIILIILIAVVFKMQQKRKTIKIIPKPPIIRPPTDDPTTLIAIECSFHEAEQEQGSSTESLASEDSSKQLIQ